MWQVKSKVSQLAPALVAALLGCGAQQLVLAEEGSILIKRNVAPRIAYRPDSPRSPKTVEVQVSPADRVTEQTKGIATLGSADDALMGNMRGGQMVAGTPATAAMLTTPANVSGGGSAGALSGAGGAIGGGALGGATMGIGSTVINAMSPLLPR